MTEKCEWYIVIKYTLDDYLGEMVDAIYSPSSVHAMYCVARGPIKPGEYIRAFAAFGTHQTNTAIALHNNRRKEERDWQLLVAHIEDAWQAASSDKPSS